MTHTGCVSLYCFMPIFFHHSMPILLRSNAGLFSFLLLVASAVLAPASRVSLSSDASGAFASEMPFRLRKSAARGFADHGWLKSYHSFSFADYYDPAFQSWGSLRVINEDFVAGGEGFPPHGHRDFEIFSYVLEGQILHEDSTGNKEVLKRGEVQHTTAGSGIRHSEYNAHPTDPLRFLQIWVAPHTRGLKPRYDRRMFPDEEKRNKLRKILSADGSDGSITLSQNCDIFASLLEDDKAVTHEFKGSKGYIHIPIMKGTKGLSVKGLKTGATAEMEAGDGLFIEGEEKIEITAHATAEGAKAVEFILFDLA